jgi:drug/metabolite transporter (DMT)-like permease
MKERHTRALVQIHFCVILWGFTAILGRTITLAALPLVWWRMLLVSAALFLFPRFWRGLVKLPPRMAGIYSGIGVIVAAHWLTFYGAIKLSNASVAATCMAMVPIFIALIEPLVAKRRFDVRELFFGIAVIPGVALVVGGTPEGMRVGLAIGILSALLAAIFGMLNKRFIEHADALTVTGVEMCSGFAFLTLLMPMIQGPSSSFVMPGRHDAILLLALALGCTLLPFALSLVALRELTAFTAALAINMEPVYAIGLAIVLLGEQHQLQRGFYLGVGIVFVVVFTHPLLRRPGEERPFLS